MEIVLRQTVNDPTKQEEVMKARSNYWWSAYGVRSDDFIEGVIAGVTAYAVWKNGRQYIGIKEEPLEDVIKEIRCGLEDQNASS